MIVPLAPSWPQDFTHEADNQPMDPGPDILQRAVLVCMDIDGVVIAHGSGQWVTQEAVSMKIPGVGRVRIAQCVLDLLAHIQTRADVRWCSRWQGSATQIISPKLSLAAWPHLVMAGADPKWSAVRDLLRVHTPPQAKENPDIRPALVWVDDNEITDEHCIHLRSLTSDLLVVRPDGKQGLTQFHCDLIRDWLAVRGAPHDPGPPAKLRRRDASGGSRMSDRAKPFT